MKSGSYDTYKESWQGDTQPWEMCGFDVAGIRFVHVDPGAVMCLGHGDLLVDSTTTAFKSLALYHPARWFSLWLLIENCKSKSKRLHEEIAVFLILIIDGKL